VEMMGWVKPSRMADFYRAVDFLLVLSRTEAQPRVVLEAMLAGAIVVAAQGNGGVDLVSDGVTGVLIAADDPTCCRRTLVELRHDPVRMAAIRRQARAFALKELRDSRHQWRHFLADLLDRGAEPPGGTDGSVLQASASGAPGLPATGCRGRRCG
jgi:glycosyltransferase involved in cell wall biosynthesis